MFYDLDGDGQEDFLAYYYSKEDQQYEVQCIHWHCDAPDESNYDNYSFRWTYLLNAMFYEDIDSLSLSAGFSAITEPNTWAFTIRSPQRMA